MQTWVDVAVLSKAKNLNGRFVAKAAAGLPFLLEEGDEVAFVPPRLDAPRRAVVASSRLLDDATAELSFEGIDGGAANVLVGSHCLIDRADLDGRLLVEGPSTWEGWTVVDGKLGEVGTVSGLIDNPAHALLQVRRPDGAKALVPVVDEIVRTVDEGARIVHVELPAGLLDL